MQSMREIKDIIKSELPRMMETDPEIREFIFKITKDGMSKWPCGMNKKKSGKKIKKRSEA